MGWLTLRWRGEAACHHLEIGAAAGFESLVARVETNAPGLSVPLQAGRYWLRLTGIDGERRAGSPSPVDAVDLEDHVLHARS